MFKKMCKAAIDIQQNPWGCFVIEKAEKESTFTQSSGAMGLEVSGVFHKDPKIHELAFPPPPKTLVLHGFGYAS